MFNRAVIELPFMVNVVMGITGRLWLWFWEGRGLQRIRSGAGKAKVLAMLSVNFCLESGRILGRFNIQSRISIYNMILFGNKEVLLHLKSEEIASDCTEGGCVDQIPAKIRGCRQPP